MDMVLTMKKDITIGNSPLLFEELIRTTFYPKIDGFENGDAIKSLWTNEKKTFKILKKMAEKEDYCVEYLFSKIYLEGWGGAVDIQESLRYLGKSASHGFVPAMVELGIYYAHEIPGSPLKINYDKAIQLFITAASTTIKTNDLNCSFSEEARNIAAYFLGKYTYFGEHGVTKDKSRGRQFLGLVMKYNHPDFIRGLCEDVLKDKDFVSNVTKIPQQKAIHSSDTRRSIDVKSHNKKYLNGKNNESASSHSDIGTSSVYKHASALTGLYIYRGIHGYAEDKALGEEIVRKNAESESKYSSNTLAREIYADILYEKKDYINAKYYYAMISDTSAIARDRLYKISKITPKENLSAPQRLPISEESTQKELAKTQVERQLKDVYIMFKENRKRFWE